MTSLPTPAVSADTIVDMVASQASDIAKSVAVPAAELAAAHLVKSRSKGIVVLIVAVSVIALLVKRRKDSNSAVDVDRPSFDGVEPAPNTEQPV